MESFLLNLKWIQVEQLHWLFIYLKHFIKHNLKRDREDTVVKAEFVV